MSDVKVRTPSLGGDVVTVLWEVWIAGAAEEVRGVVDRLGPGVRCERREAVCQALLKTYLQRVVIRIRARLEQVNVVEARIGPRHKGQSRRQHAWLRLIDI